MIRNTAFSVLVSLFCTTAFAQNEATSTFPAPAKPQNTSEMRSHVGVIAGYSNPEGPYKSAVGYGADFGFQPYIPFGVGAELASTANDGDLTRTTLLGRVTYNFGGNTPIIKNSYVGAMLGPVWDTESDNDGVRFGIAPVIGFDIPLGKEMTEKTVTLGANARYLFVNEGVQDTFALNGAIKYWF